MYILGVIYIEADAYWGRCTLGPIYIGADILLAAHLGHVEKLVLALRLLILSHGQAVEVHALLKSKLSTF